MNSTRRRIASGGERHYATRMRYIILPQGLKISVPATIGFLVQLVKGPSLAAIIGFTEPGGTR